MGKIITSVGKSLTPSNWLSNNVRYTNAAGYIRLEENDTDSLHKVDLVIIAQVYVTATATGTYTYPEGAVQVSISGDYTATASTDGGTLKNTNLRIVTKSVTVATFDRTTEPQPITIYLQAMSTGGGSASGGYTLTVPPLKQNATNSGRRITYTSDGVKYDLLNYL